MYIICMWFGKVCMVCVTGCGFIMIVVKIVYLIMVSGRQQVCVCVWVIALIQMIMILCKAQQVGEA
jgi:hypothetical protein